GMSNTPRNTTTPTNAISATTSAVAAPPAQSVRALTFTARGARSGGWVGKLMWPHIVSPTSGRLAVFRTGEHKSSPIRGDTGALEGRRVRQLARAAGFLRNMILDELVDSFRVCRTVR